VTPDPHRPRRKNGRRHWRFTPPRVTAAVVAANDRRRRCLLVNLSRSGARVRFPARLAPGTPVIVSHSLAGTIAGRCVWQVAGITGIAFEEPLRPLDRALRCLALLLHPGPSTAAG